MVSLSQQLKIGRCLVQSNKGMSSASNRIATGLPRFKSSKAYFENYSIREFRVSMKSQ
jgi:hypothetical protein